MSGKTFTPAIRSYRRPFPNPVNPPDLWKTPQPAHSTPNIKFVKSPIQLLWCAIMEVEINPFGAPSSGAPFVSLHCQTFEDPYTWEIQSF